MAASRYFRESRIRLLLETLRLIWHSKTHLGASESEDFHFDFDGAYNSPEKIEENGPRTRDDVMVEGDDELASAKNRFRLACKHCEFAKTCGDKEAKERIFYQLFDSKKVRTRFRNRIKSPPLKNGDAAAPCATLIRPGRLKPTKDLVSL